MLCFPLRILIVIAFLSWRLPTRKRSDATSSLPKAHAEETWHQIPEAFSRSACSGVKPVSCVRYGPEEDTTDFIFLFFVGAVRKAEGCTFISTEHRAEYYHWPRQLLALCPTAQDSKSVSANPHSRPFPNTKSLQHCK